jgi:hypothetical protein
VEDPAGSIPSSEECRYDTDRAYAPDELLEESDVKVDDHTFT